jgi:glycosyltransferase involved in cell wall biosynthesis
MSVTVIIPSIGRKTITRTLNSLISQTNPNWLAAVGFDGLKKEAVSDLTVQDPRISYFFLPKVGGGLNHGGSVRNVLLDFAATEWVCFLDDDDTFRPDYIEKLQELANQDYDVVMFRMSYDPSDTNVIPRLGIQKPMIMQTGISFAVRKSFLDKHSLRFFNSGAEDFMLLLAIEQKGGKFHFSPHITYNIRF